MYSHHLSHLWKQEKEKNPPPSLPRAFPHENRKQNLDTIPIAAQFTPLIVKCDPVSGDQVMRRELHTARIRADLDDRNCLLHWTTGGQKQLSSGLMMGKRVKGNYLTTLWVIKTRTKGQNPGIKTGIFEVTVLPSK